MATSNLESLPVELLAHIIATYLTTKDLGSLRLTSSYLEKALFDSFAREFFSKKQFMLTEPSLAVLVAISKHPALSRVLSHVIIGLEQYSSDTYTFNFESPYQLRAFRNGAAEQTFFTATGQDRFMLAEAFRNLPNLKTIGIRDYSAHGRLRDDDSWHSYGMNTVREQTGRELRCYTGGPYDFQAKFASKAFSTLLIALADAGTTSVRNIEVFLRSRARGLTDFAFLIPLSSSQKLDALLNNLETVLLTVNLDCQKWQCRMAATPPEPPIETNEELKPFLGEFLQRTPHLKHLRLNFQRMAYDGTDEMMAFLQGSPSSSPVSIPHISLFSQLKTLDLGILETPLKPLVGAIRNFSTTLRSLSLWRVTLRDKENQWQTLLLRLKAIPELQLNHLMLGCLAEKPSQNDEHTGWIESKHVQFRTITDGVETLEAKRECKGDIKNSAIPQLVKDLFVRTTQSQLSDDSSVSESHNGDTEDSYISVDDISIDDSSVEVMNAMAEILEHHHAAASSGPEISDDPMLHPIYLDLPLPP